MVVVRIRAPEAEASGPRRTALGVGRRRMLCAYRKCEQGRGISARAPRAKDFTNRNTVAKVGSTEVEKAKNRTKSQVRAKVERTIGVIKRVFGFQKVRYRALAKNLHRLEVTAALANIYTVRRRLLHA